MNTKLSHEFKRDCALNAPVKPMSYETLRQMLDITRQEINRHINGGK